MCRTIGNQAVQRLVKSGTLQAKLKIGQPGDKYEQEADRVADKVMRMPEPQAASGGSPHIQRACPSCEEDELRWQPIEEEEEELRRQPIEEEEEELQTKTASGSIPEVQPNIKSHFQSLKGGGQPLSENDRAFFEPRFGHDFSQVRVHSDARATESARAFTVGRDMVFGAGECAPGTHEGRKLLAHELTHVVQQTHDTQYVQRVVTGMEIICYGHFHGFLALIFIVSPQVYINHKFVTPVRKYKGRG